MNKKVIKILSFAFISFFTSIFIVGNAKASTLIDNFDFTVYNSNFTFPYKTEELGEYENNYNRAYQYYLDNCQGIYDSYIIDKNGYGYGWGDNQVNLLCFNQSDNVWIPSVEMYYNQDSSIWLNYRIEIFKPNNNDYIAQHFYNTTSTTSYSYEQIKFDLYNYEKINNKTLSKESGIIDTNIKFYFNSNQYQKGTYAINSFIYEGQTYTVGDLIYENGSFAGSKPTISFSKTENKENNHVTSVDVNIKFSIIDNDKYIYQYKQNELDGWVTYQFNDTDNFTLNYEKNDILYVRVLDKNTFEEITTSTYNISSLLPYLVLKHDDNSDCYVDNKQVCDNIRVYPNLMTYDKYMFYYSEDGGTTWLTSYSAFIKTVTESNKTYLFKITDLEGNIIDNLSYTQSPFGEFDTSYPYVKFEYKIDKNLLVYYLDTYLYNYDTSKYKFYYSENGKDFYELLQNKYVANYNDVYLKTYNPFIQMFSLKFTKNSYVYIKITDLEGNSLGTYTHFIDYDKALEELDNSWFKPIKEFIDNNIFNKLPIIQQLIDIYNSFQYVEGKDEPPVFDFDLGFIGLGNVTIKMDFFNEYRQTFFDYMKIFFSITTVFAVLTELKDVIGGGD